MTAERFAGPVAILLGFALLSFVVWRASQRIVTVLEVGAPPASSTGVVANATPVSPAPPGTALPPKVTELDRELRVRDEAQDAIVAQRSQYQRLCSKRIPPATPPEHGAFEVDVVFDASGVETSRTFRTVGPLPAPNWLACAREQKLAPLRASPLGRTVTVTVTLPLP